MHLSFVLLNMNYLSEFSSLKKKKKSFYASPVRLDYITPCVDAKSCFLSQKNNENWEIDL